MKDQIKKIFEENDIKLKKEELEKFGRFLEIFIEKNSQINLSAIREPSWIILKHFLDSVMLNIFINFGEQQILDNRKIKIADIGTWWWFPLIPLAITNEKIDFLWIDSVWKKLKAIDEFVIDLWIKNIKTINKRAEDVWKDEKYREQFDFVVSRSVAYLPTLLEYSIPLLKKWWIFCAYKLDDKEELKSSKKILKKLQTKIIKVKNYKISWQKRVIIFMEKLQNTPKNYPRKVWIPSLKPII